MRQYSKWHWVLVGRIKKGMKWTYLLLVDLGDTDGVIEDEGSEDWSGFKGIAQITSGVKVWDKKAGSGKETRGSFFWKQSSENKRLQSQSSCRQLFEARPVLRFKRTQAFLGWPTGLLALMYFLGTSRFWRLGLSQSSSCPHPSPPPSLIPSLPFLLLCLPLCFSSNFIIFYFNWFMRFKFLKFRDVFFLVPSLPVPVPEATGFTSCVWNFPEIL